MALLKNNGVKHNVAFNAPGLENQSKEMFGTSVRRKLKRPRTWQWIHVLMNQPRAVIVRINMFTKGETMERTKLQRNKRETKEMMGNQLLTKKTVTA